MCIRDRSGLDELIDFYDDMLWQSFYAASLSPSYLNRQPYGFLVQDHSSYLVQQEDAYTENLDAALDLGIVMLHFSAVASQWAGQVRWELSPAAPDGLPEGLRSAAEMCIRDRNSPAASAAEKPAFKNRAGKRDTALARSFPKRT